MATNTQDALRKYGRHIGDCLGGLSSSKRQCTCGFDAALSAAPASEQQPAIESKKILLIWNQSWDAAVRAIKAEGLYDNDRAIHHQARMRQPIEFARALLAQQAADTSADKKDHREAVRDAVAQSLTSVYYCGRVWSAWQVGTMTEDDFLPAADVDEVLDEITDAVIAAQSQPEGGSK